MTPVLADIIDDFRREPSRTGSLVITLFGDAIVPRGGSVWLGTLLDFFAALDIDGGVVRTAVSRLASDGWLARTKVGRNSFYRLAGAGRSAFDAAVRHVYDPPPTRRPDLLFALDGSNRDATRAKLLKAGLGSPLPGVYLAPPDVEMSSTAGLIRLELPDGAAARALVAASWPFEEIASGYGRFVATFAPMRSLAQRGPALDDLDAFIARILLVHGYRRVMLREPLLPSELLPNGWPGPAARQLCRDIYRTLLPASERWLDAHGSNETGSLPRADPTIRQRFG